MTQPEPPPYGPVVDPFAAGDPLVYSELSPHWLALRALMSVLAETGASVRWPVELAPRWVDVEIAAGWTLRPQFHASLGSDTITMTVRRTTVPPQLLDGIRLIDDPVNTGPPWQFPPGQAPLECSCPGGVHTVKCPGPPLAAPAATAVQPREGE